MAADLLVSRELQGDWLLVDYLVPHLSRIGRSGHSLVAQGDSLEGECWYLRFGGVRGGGHAGKALL